MYPSKQFPHLGRHMLCHHPRDSHHHLPHQKDDLHTRMKYDYIVILEYYCKMRDIQNKKVKKLKELLD